MAALNSSPSPGVTKTEQKELRGRRRHDRKRTQCTKGEMAAPGQNRYCPSVLPVLAQALIINFGLTPNTGKELQTHHDDVLVILSAEVRVLWQNRQEAKEKKNKNKKRIDEKKNVAGCKLFVKKKKKK